MKLLQTLILTASLALVTQAMANEQTAPAPEKTEATAATAASAGTVTCKSGAETRTIAKADAEGGGCEVIYTKDGVANSVAQAKNELAHCDNVKEKIKTNLTTAGWTCE